MAGDDLPPLASRALHLREARPQPERGPVRDGLVAVTEAQSRAAEDAFTASLNAYLGRVEGIVTARMGGVKGRRFTRFWNDSKPFEVKAVDPDYVVPDRLVTDAGEALRPVALRVASDVAAHTAEKLGVTVPDTTGDGMFAIDHDALAAAVDDAIKEILGVAQHHAEEVRAAVLAADTGPNPADDLDEVLDRIEQAHRKGGGWVLMAGRTLANALTNDAAMRTAAALGVTHAQWLSKRDPRVRATHRVADGQVRPLGEKYKVGRFRLLHPGDPTDLPASWPEIANCRCGLLFRPPDDVTKEVLRVLLDAAPGVPGPNVVRLLDAATGAPAPRSPVDLAGLVPGEAGRQVTVPAPVIGYRPLAGQIAATAGQIAVTPAIALALAAPVVFDAAHPALAVVIPAGAVVTVVALAGAQGGSAVALPEGTELEIVGSSPAGVQARLAA